MNEHDLIQSVRSKVDIVDVISSYIPLVQKGKNYFGVCPFHDDTNPSMSVSRSLQIYKCFSCGASGNVFNFVMDYEHITFKEALELLAKKAGVEVKGLKLKKENTQNEPYYKMYELALKFYQNNLNTSFGHDAKEYLKKRKIDDDVIKEFDIGLSLTSMDSLVKLLTDKGYSLDTLDKLGLVSNEHDTYINRIMFPLWDLNGRVVGFSGRIYDNSKLNKYLNTKETPIFKKGELLYHYHIAREEVRTKKYVIVMEGFMDVIRASTIGYRNVVALMGTAMTKEQANLIKRLSNDVILCFDGDDAGRHATLVNGEELIQLGLNPKVIALENDYDPDTYIIDQGKERFDALVENAIYYSDFKIQSLKKDVNMNSDIDKANYINQVIYEAAKISDEIRVEIILKNLAKEFDISYNTLEKRLQDVKEKAEIKPDKKEVETLPPKEKPRRSKYDLAAMAIIYYMLKSDKAIRLYRREELYFPTADERHLGSEIDYYRDTYGSLEVADLFTYFQDKKNLSSLLTEVLSLNLKEEISDEELEEYADVIRSYRLNEEVKRLQKMIKEEVDPLQKAVLAERIRKLKMGVE